MAVACLALFRIAIGGQLESNASPYPVYYYYADKTSSTTLGTKSLGYGPGQQLFKDLGANFQSKLCNVL